MTTFTPTLGRTDFDTPRPLWVRVLNFLQSRDALYRERHRLAELDDHILRDIGLNRGDVASALRRPEEHLESILLRSDDQLQH